MFIALPPRDDDSEQETTRRPSQLRDSGVSGIHWYPACTTGHLFPRPIRATRSLPRRPALAAGRGSPIGPADCRLSRSRRLRRCASSRRSTLSCTPWSAARRASSSCARRSWRRWWRARGRLSLRRTSTRSSTGSPSRRGRRPCGRCGRAAGWSSIRPWAMRSPTPAAGSATCSRSSITVWERASCGLPWRGSATPSISGSTRCATCSRCARVSPPCARRSTRPWPPTPKSCSAVRPRSSVRPCTSPSASARCSTPSGSIRPRRGGWPARSTTCSRGSTAPAPPCTPPSPRSAASTCG